jgi:hypothetical protein
VGAIQSVPKLDWRPFSGREFCSTIPLGFFEIAREVRSHRKLEICAPRKGTPSVTRFVFSAPDSGECSQGTGLDRIYRMIRITEKRKGEKEALVSVSLHHASTTLD